MDLWIWIVSGAVAATLIVLIDRIVRYAVVFRRKQPKGGVPLEEYLESAGGRIPMEAALAMLEPVIRRLAQFHTNGRFHLDVCPQRIVALPQTQKLALLAPGERGSIQPGYFAPEQYGGKTGTWTDVYAAAAVLYRITTGKNPPDVLVRLEDDTEALQAVAGVDAPGEIKWAWLRAFSLQPEARFHNCGMLVQELYPHSKPPAEQVGLKRK